MSGRCETSPLREFVDQWGHLPINILPCGGRDCDSGKLPVTLGSLKANGEPKRFKWDHSIFKGQTENTKRKLAYKWPEANVGIICGKVSGITVIDVDDQADIEKAIQTFGATPLMVQTVKGTHLYYRFNGEKSETLTKYGLRGELQADGRYVIAPPSLRYDVEGNYRFDRGDYSHLNRLPKLKLPKAKQETKAKYSANNPAPEGFRTNHMFLSLKDEFPYCDSLDDLEDRALTIRENETKYDLGHPFTEKDAISQARSVWDKGQAGHLFFRGDPKGYILRNASAVDYLFDFSLQDEKGKKTCSNIAFAAMALYIKLVSQWSRRDPYGNPERFYICAKPMANKTLGCSENTIRKATKLLIDAGAIMRVHKGTGPGNPSVYVFS